MDGCISRRRFISLASLSWALWESPARTDQAAHGDGDDLEQWIERQRQRSIAYLLANVAPKVTYERDVETVHIAPERLEPVRQAASDPMGAIHLAGSRFRQVIQPSPGSVAAAAPPRPREPDYFFHWIRDSALVMREVAALADSPKALGAADYDRLFVDFVRFSSSLQANSAVGAGEPRFNLDGTVDALKWSRPQWDGPALRALTMMRYEGARNTTMTAEARALLDNVVRLDLDQIADTNGEAGFDLWEEYRGHDFHRRVVQFAALEQGCQRAAAAGDATRVSRYGAVRDALRSALEVHWNAKRARYDFFVGPKVYWDGSDRPKPGDNLDAAVLMAAVHGRLAAGRFSLLDDRILSTAVQVEDLFASVYPINRARGTAAGLLYGRYAGDLYFGGNPFVFITHAIAEVFYGVAELVSRQGSLPVTNLNRAFVLRAQARAVAGNDSARQLSSRVRIPECRGLCLGSVLRGDDILRAVMKLTPGSGELPEEFDKADGTPASCKNLSWSHASFLAATAARGRALAALNGS